MLLLAVTTTRRWLEFNPSDFDAIKDFGAAILRVLEQDMVALRTDDVPGVSTKGKEVRVSWGLAVIAE